MQRSLLNRAVFVAVVMLLLVAPTRAAELAGVNMDDSITLDDQQLVLNGLSLRTATMLKVKVYVIGLYLEERSQDDKSIIASSQRKRVIMHFVREVGADDLRKGWKDGFKKNTRDLKPIQARLDTFQGAMRDVKVGERLVMDFVGENVEVRVDDELIATIEGNDFQQALIGCWLGPKPLTKELKAGMLGKG